VRLDGTSVGTGVVSDVAGGVASVEVVSGWH